METKNNQTLRIAVVSIVTMGLAIALVKALLTYAQLNLSEVFGAVLNLPFWMLAVAIAGMLFNIMCGAQNWRLTVERVSTENRQSYLFYLAYSAMSAIFGLVIPSQISNLVIRSLSLKFMGNASTQKSTVTALVSQAHDMTVSIAFLIPGMTALFGGASAVQWLAYEILLVGGGYFLFSRYTFVIVQKICAWNIKNKSAQKVLNLLKEGMHAGLFDNSLMSGLYINSLAKFLALAMRTYLLAVVLGLGASFMQIASIFSVLQLSIAFTITPGNLGVIEWGWVGLLVHAGFSTYDAGHFTLTLRALGYAATALVFAVVMGSYVLQTKLKK